MVLDLLRRQRDEAPVSAHEPQRHPLWRHVPGEEPGPDQDSSLLGKAALDEPFLAPYQAYGDITLHHFGGTANYNSLQTSLTRRFARGLEFGVNRTWARSLGTCDDRGNFNRIDGTLELPTTRCRR